MRPLLHDVLGHVVHARISMTGLQQSIILEMSTGYRVTYRGYEWGREQLAVVEDIALALDRTFDLLKSLQFPEDKSRLLNAPALPALSPHTPPPLPDQATH